MLGTALEYAQFQHQVISQNIANVNTPGFQAGSGSFAQFLEIVRSPSLDSSTTHDFQVEPTAGLTARADGNNVDLDQEFADLKRNSLLFQTFSQLLAAKLDTMRRAITG